MKTIAVPTRAKTLNDVLKKARRNGLILQSANGNRFVLTPIENWEGFNVGAGKDFAEEVKLTAQNKKLMTLLASRRSHGQKIPLAKIKSRFGLD